MSSGFFGDQAPLVYEGPQSDSPLAYRWYDPDRQVMGRSMAEHLRFAVCYWHSFCWHGGDPFGGQTFERPWFQGADEMSLARLKADVAFELFTLLGVPFFTFHDRDIAPEGASLAETNRNLMALVEVFEGKMQASGLRLLWGTANLFSHRRYMSGAATNPDPEIFTYAAAQVKTCLDVTKRLDGSNYVLWGGREGYETLLNTDLAREMDQLGRFMSLVVEHTHKIGFEGQILIEPKPREPLQQHYDFDVAAVYGFLKRYGLEREIRVNIEQNHAILAGHSFEHEIALAQALGVFGSIDINRGDYQSGWDTDQFAMNVPELARALYAVLAGGGFKQGGLNFDAKLRRQSLDPADLIHAHANSMDAIARALLIAAKTLEDGKLQGEVDARYAGWEGAEGKAILAGERSLEDLAGTALAMKREPQPRSGRQEFLEGLANRYL